MQYFNTRDRAEQVSFKEATLKGLAGDNGLFMPERIPELPGSMLNDIEQIPDVGIALTCMYPFVKGSIGKHDLEKILVETLTFPLPIVDIGSNLTVLELFHGPTKAFKDVGARFMSRCLSQFTSSEKKTTVLVATSGDTGSAVANGFFDVEGIDVKILFPKAKISPYQEYQMTSLGRNIRCVEVDGTFDDCQALVKRAFNDPDLNRKMQLSSANSINVARLLPQMLYYVLAYKQLKGRLKDRKWGISVPCGNFGNLTAGLIARRMGLPIYRFIAANNANDTFFHYLKTGNYTPKPSVTTFSNAMDVGAPSNFERIMSLYDSNHEALTEDISSYRINDEETLSEINETNRNNDYVLDPHGAVALSALKREMESEPCLGTFLETAHPSKFESIVRMAIPDYPVKDVNLDGCAKVSIGNDYGSFVDLLKQ